MRWNRLLLRLYPASFRNEYGSAMCAIFQRRLRDAGPAGRVLVWIDAIGLHGPLAFTVSTRAREIGVRIAPGAASRDILRLVVGQAAVLALTALLLGVALACAAGRTMQTLLAGISPADTATFAAAVILVAFVTFVGTMLFARRALRTDPLIATRIE